MSIPAPVECLTLPDCCAVPTSPFYGQGITFLNGQTGFLLTCPPGFNCEAGAYPHPIIVDKGVIEFRPPPGQNPLRATCCDGVQIAAWLPDGFTFEQFAAAAQSLVDQMATHLAGCMATQYNATHSTSKKKCNITTAATLPEGNVGVPYSATLAQTGLDDPVTWSLVSGALPPGLSLSSGGTISGTPTGVGASYGFTVRAKHDTTSCTKLFTLTINGCGEDTDWCGDPGTCRLRVKDFNLLDWTYDWEGTLPNLDPAVPPAIPCSGFFDNTGNVGLTYSSVGQYWQLSILCDDFTTYLATLPDLTGADPLGIYTKTGGSDPACGGPNTFELEAYVP